MCDMMELGKGEDKEELSERIQWAEHDSTDDGSISFISLEEFEKIEQRFPLSAFLHRRDIGNLETKETDRTFLDTPNSNFF